MKPGITEGLRERQKALAHDAILSAVADQIAEVGLMEFSMPDIAHRAGVSQRTVYNYFANRTELVAALGDWVTDKMIARGFPTSIEKLDDVPRVIRFVYELFSEMEGLSRAFARADDTTDAASRAARDERTVEFAALVDAAVPGLPEQRRRQIAMLLRTLGSSRYWYMLTVDLGLDADSAAEAAAWAAERLIEAAKTEAAEGAQR